RVLQAIGAYADVANGAHQAPGYETRRNGVRVSFERINATNPFLLMTMTRQHLYSAILASIAREGIEIVMRSEAVAARPEGVLELADGRSLKADLVIAADGVRSAVRDSLGGNTRMVLSGCLSIVADSSAGPGTMSSTFGCSNLERCASCMRPAKMVACIWR